VAFDGDDDGPVGIGVVWCDALGVPRTIGWHPLWLRGRMIELIEMAAPWRAGNVRARPAWRLMASAMTVSSERALQPGMIPRWSEL
jgi:hypothetical protein